MSFDDLPDDWPRRSVTDPEIVDDLLDLLVADRDRAEGAVCLLICRANGRLVQPCAIQGPPEAATSDERHLMLQSFVTAIEMVGGRGLVLATARPHGTVVDDVDRDWHQSALEMCRANGIRLLGAYRVSLDGVTQLPDPDTLPVLLGA